MKKLPITTDHLVAVNQAISILNQSASDHAEQCVFHLKKLAEILKPVQTCTACKCETDILFAPFDEGKAEYCSDCQMEAENEFNERYEDNWED